MRKERRMDPPAAASPMSYAVAGKSPERFYSYRCIVAGESSSRGSGSGPSRIETGTIHQDDPFPRSPSPSSSSSSSSSSLSCSWQGYIRIATAALGQHCELSHRWLPLFPSFLSMGWALLLSRCYHHPPRTWLQWQEPRRWSVQSSLERSPLSCLTEMSAAGHPTVTEQTIHLFRQVSCNSGADHLLSRTAMLGSPTPMKGIFHILHHQWTSVSGRCNYRISHWKGAVTLIPTCFFFAWI